MPKLMEEYIPWLSIKLYPDECLNSPCEPVEEVTEDIHTLVEDMVQTMYTAEGVGLAAPQVGKNIRVVVMDCSKNRGKPKLRRLVNPRILAKRGHISTEEGCLSFPGLSLHVARAREIDVEAMSLSGELINFSCRNLEAVCLQHEIDHLDGITFEKRVSRQVRRAAFRKLEKKKKQMEI